MRVNVYQCVSVQKRTYNSLILAFDELKEEEEEGEEDEDEEKENGRKRLSFQSNSLKDSGFCFGFYL